MEFIEKDDYFEAYEDLTIHHLMLKDKPRTLAYKNAIESNKHLFENKVVLDVGSGTGILSMFAAKLGNAKKVYAVEASKVAKLSEELIKDNKLQDKIQVLNEQVENINLKEQVDIIISEWMGNFFVIILGFYLFHESMFDSVLFARDKFLKKGGMLFPSHAIIYASPCSMKNEFTDQIQFWDNVYDFDFSRVSDHFLNQFTEKPYVGIIPKDDILSKEALVKKFDLLKVKLSELKSFNSKVKFTVEKKGIMNGICIWFDVFFGNEKNILSTSPYSEETHWKQTIIVLPSKTGFEVEEKTEIGCLILFEQDRFNYRHYSISIELD